MRGLGYPFIPLTSKFELDCFSASYALQELLLRKLQRLARLGNPSQSHAKRLYQSLWYKSDINIISICPKIVVMPFSFMVN